MTIYYVKYSTSAIVLLTKFVDPWNSTRVCVCVFFLNAEKFSMKIVTTTHHYIMLPIRTANCTTV